MLPVLQRLALAAPVEEGAGGVEHRVRVGVLHGRRRGGGGSRGSAARARPSVKPASGAAASQGIGVRQPSRPLKLGPEGDAERVLELLEGELRLLQAQLLALVEADRAAQGAQQDRAPAGAGPRAGRRRPSG